jgi:hypothetical protein
MNHLIRLPRYAQDENGKFYVTHEDVFNITYSYVDDIYDLNVVVNGKVTPERIYLKPILNESRNSSNRTIVGKGIAYYLALDEADKMPDSGLKEVSFMQFKRCQRIVLTNQLLRIGLFARRDEQVELGLYTPETID